jgi:hypothetical protein
MCRQKRQEVAVAEVYKYADKNQRNIKKSGFFKKRIKKPGFLNKPGFWP